MNHDDHDDCGHNHDPNPYTDPDRSAAYGHMIRSLFRIGTLTVGLDQRLTVTNAACTLIAATDASDRMPTMRAVMWELGSLVNIMTGGNEPSLEFADGCTDPTHNHGDMDRSTVEGQFGMDSMSAFFAAASVGNLQGAVNVVDAVHLEATQRDIDGDALVAQFFGNTLTSVAYTARVNLSDPLALFTDD